jgi:hypothetical protein
MGQVMEHGERSEAKHGVRGVVPGSCVRVTGETTRVAIPGSSPTEPQVEVIRQGDVIQAIDVVCTCGQRIRLRCVYQ